MLLGVLGWAFILCGCAAEPPAPIQGEINTADKDAPTAKPGGGQQATTDPNGK
jgi:hypothetical protein